MNKIILASASPRRYEILKSTGLQFKIITADIDESMPGGIEPSLAVMGLAAKKAAAVAKKKRGSLVIGADTIVVLNGRILGKPKDEDEAFCMLKSLSGECHEVLTGVAVVRSDDGMMVAEYEKTKVYFKELSDSDIKDYVKTGEPMDKAGAYGIQGKGGGLVQKIEGDFNNVVGLPDKRLLRILKEEFGVITGGDE